MVCNNSEAMELSSVLICLSSCLFFRDFFVRIRAPLPVSDVLARQDDLEAAWDASNPRDGADPLPPARGWAAFRQRIRESLANTSRRIRFGVSGQETPEEEPERSRNASLAPYLSAGETTGQIVNDILSGEKATTSTPARGENSGRRGRGGGSSHRKPRCGQARAAHCGHPFRTPAPTAPPAKAAPSRNQSFC